jgi:hypothetical protein
MPLTSRQLGWSIISGLLILACASSASAQTDFKGRFAVSVTGLYESGGTAVGKGAGDTPYDAASPNSLGYLDLRTDFLARKINGSDFSVKVDFRIRFANDYQTPPTILNTQLVGQTFLSRGYQGGPEEDLRELYVNYDVERFTATLGRIILQEAAAVQFDGATAALKTSAWNVGVFGGLFPDPFSRSDFRNYSTAAYTGGAYASYKYKNIWGSLAAYAVYLGGTAGPLDPLVNPTSNPLDTEGLRFFIFWQDYLRPTQSIDVYSYLLMAGSQKDTFDVYNGSLMVHLRAGPNWRILFHYGHFGAIAFDTFLRDLQRCDPASLAIRAGAGMSGCLRNTQVANIALGGAGLTNLNNLDLRRVSRDDVRVHVDFNWGARWTLYVEPRFRLRSLDQLTYEAGADGSYAIDATVGFRDRGLPLGLRTHLFYTYTFNYTSLNHLARVELGRDFGEIAFIEGSFAFQYNDDSLLSTEPYGAGQKILLEGGLSGGFRFRDFFAYTWLSYFNDAGINAFLGVVRLEYRL